MDFKRIINAAMVPTIILVVLGIIGTILGFLLGKFLPFIGGIIGIVLGLGIFVVECLILGWAGYSAAKKYQLDVVGAALTGALSAFVASIINGIISIVLSLVGLMPVVSSNPLETTIGGAATLVFLLIGLVIGVVIYTVIGVVLGAIGGFLGQGKKK